MPLIFLAPVQPPRLSTGEPDFSRIGPAYGAAIARLHDALATFPDPRVAVRTWREDPIRQMYDDRIPQLLEYLDPPASRDLQIAIDAFWKDYCEALTGLPEQLIHRDCHLGNVLARGYEVIGFIDCDHFSIGSVVLDLAYFLVHLVKWRIDEEAVRTASRRMASHFVI